MFNWVGNKIRYLSRIQEIAAGFETIVDPMMGSGNVLTRLAPRHKIIGGDVVPLMPNIYTNFHTFYREETYLRAIVDNFKFAEDGDYYNFRDHWNYKYENHEYDEWFMVETFLLFKMCSNSMVRFNKSGKFNTPFRGFADPGKPFFSDAQFPKFARQLEEVAQCLAASDHPRFNVWNWRQTINGSNVDPEKTLYILDPPYALQTETYKADEYTTKDEDDLLEFISGDRNFILFNFLEWEDQVHERLQATIEANDFHVNTLRESSSSGQARKGTKYVKEVLVSNVNPHADFWE